MNHPARLWAHLMATAFLLAAEGCIIVSDDNGGAALPCLEGEGAVETTNISLPAFTGIELRSDVELILSQGPVQRVELRAHANVADELLFDIDGADLEIRTLQCIAPAGRPQLFITVPELGRIINSSAAPVVSDNTFVTDKLEIAVAGSGDVDIAAIADEVRASIAGSGSLLMEGEAATSHIKITGSGDFHGFNLATQSTYVLITGSGDAEVLADAYLDASLGGSGNVFFKGQPVLEVRLTGTGEVFDAN